MECQASLLAGEKESHSLTSESCDTGLSALRRDFVLRSENLRLLPRAIEATDGWKIWTSLL